MSNHTFLFWIHFAHGTRNHRKSDSIRAGGERLSGFVVESVEILKRLDLVNYTTFQNVVFKTR